MKKLFTLFCAAVVAATMFSSCDGQKEEPTKRTPTSTTAVMRFVSTQDLTDFYDISITYTIPGSDAKTVKLVFDKEITSADFPLTAINAGIAESLKGAFVEVGPITAACDVAYKINFTRTSKAVDTSAKYDIEFGQDLTTFDGNKMCSGSSGVMGGFGIKGEMVEEYMTRHIGLWGDEDSFHVPFNE